MDNYSYTELSTYLQCPLKYKYHYRDGWTERDDKANLTLAGSSKWLWSPNSW